MREGRAARAAGDWMVLGQTAYRIEGLEGSGGCSVVYRAVYEDSLNKGQLHEVLIKELYPWTPDGSIYRDGNGSIRCRPEAEALMQRSRQSFYRGNAANLELLKSMPDRISGNLNSFEAYGTYYSVLPLHGGTSLQDILDGAGSSARPACLKQIAEIVLQILDALEGFHRAGILHLDISPDNILMLPSYAMLIDYNSVWTAGSDPEEFLFSEKPGYVSPEVRLRDFSGIGPQSDLYSVAAVFFRMVTGRRMDADDMLGRGLKKSLNRELPVLANVPVTAAQKAVQILAKGLHVLPRKRYSGIAEMRTDLRELINRIEKRGITTASLWEESRAAYRRMVSGNTEYITREIITADGSLLTMEDIGRELGDGGKLLLTGPGGMGKTQLLRAFWKEGVKAYRSDIPIVIYVPLSGYQEAGAEACYIRKYILRSLLTGDNEGSHDTFETCLQELDMLLGGAGAGTNEKHGDAGFIVLLDGLNEAGVETGLLLKEIEGLGSMERVGILLTDRTDGVLEYALKGFSVLSLKSLSEESVRWCLGINGLEYPESGELARTLTNPMLLRLYIEAKTMEGTAGDAGEAGAVRDSGSMHGIIRQYMDSLCRAELRRASGNKAEQIRSKYLLQQLLPDIALDMRQRGRTLLTLEELARLLESDYRKLRSREFAEAFKEYTGKSRLLLEGIADGREWFDYCVNEQLVEHTGLMEETEGHSYHFVHDNFIETLAMQAEENRERIRLAGRKRRIRRGVPWAMAAAAAVCVMVWVVLTVGQGSVPAGLTASEEELLMSAAVRLEMNMSVVSRQLGAQEELLGAMEEPGVLLGDGDALIKLLDEAEPVLLELERAYNVYDDGSEHVSELESMGRGIPVDILSELYTAPQELKIFYSNNMKLLLERLCGPDSVYDSVEKREPMTEAYEEYLEAFRDIYYVRYCRYLSVMEELGAVESADRLEQAIEQEEAFTDCVISFSPGNMSAEVYEDKLGAAGRKLDEAGLGLARVNMYY